MIQPPIPSGSEPTPASSLPPQPQMPPVRVLVKAKVPSITYFFLATTILVFIFQMLSTFSLRTDVLEAIGVKDNALILSGQIWRLITPIWLHANILHIFFNMYALFVIGPGLEQQYGHGRFLALYLLTGFAGNTLSFLFSSADSLGASTAIFGLIGAEAVFLLQNRKLMGKRGSRMLINICIVIALNLAISLTPGIDLWGHLGGLIVGLLFAWMAGPIWQVSPGIDAFEISDRRPGFRYLQATVILFILISAAAASKFFIK